MALLATKLLLAPLCVIAVSLAGRRWGVGVAGVLGGLPVVAGPILLVFTLVHGSAFGAEAAAGTLLGLVALTTFVVVYGRVAPAVGPLASVLMGWTSFLLCVALLTLFDDPPPGVSLVLAGAGFAIGLSLLPPPPRPPSPAGALPWWDLPARGFAALTLVLALTAVSGALGPGLSGLLAPFPIITSVLAVFTHRHGDADQVRVLLRNFLVGFYGYATFCFVLAVGLPSLGIAGAFIAALALALAVQAGTFVLRSRLLPALASR
ncbi:MAG TPA: hypothetical protein VII45_10065 [Solirubrobacterales bacterium]